MSIEKTYKHALSALSECIIQLNFLESMLNGTKCANSLKIMESDGVELSDSEYEDISEYYKSKECKEERDCKRNNGINKSYK
jgi:hypothetical protein